MNAYVGFDADGIKSPIRALSSIGTVSGCLSVCSHLSATGWIPADFDIEDFYKNLSIKPTFGSNQTKISDTLHDDLSMFYCYRRNKMTTIALSSSEMISGY
jgi:hypothetical protein